MKVRHWVLRRVFWILGLGVLLLPALAMYAAHRSGQSANTNSPKSPGSQKKSPAGDALRQNTLGVAYLNQGKAAEGQKYFEQALTADPEFALAKMNLGIALLAQQKMEQARAALEDATAKLPDDPYAWFNLGLVYKDAGEPAKAIAAFQHVEKIAPEEPDAFYFEGYLNSQLQQYDQAIPAFEKALKLAPYHASAQFGLARALQRKGDTEAAREGMKRFQKITADHLGIPFGAGYGDQGKFSLAKFVARGETGVPAEIAVRYEVQALQKLINPSGQNSAGVTAKNGACFLDFDGDGKADLFLIGAGNGKSQLLHNLGSGRFEDVTSKAGLAGVGAGYGCAAGDFDNDGKTDLAFCEVSGVRLFHNEGGGKFADVTEKVGIRRQAGCVSPMFVDYDHDGDLDLYLTFTAAGVDGKKARNVLWRNNGNSTFTDVSEETGLGVEATGGGAVTTDINNDRAIDLVLAGGARGADVYLNPREGKFTELPAIDFAKEKLPPAVGVVAFDFNKDGWMDLAFTHAGAPGISLWRNVDGKRMERVALPDFGWSRGSGIAWVDFDNDGWLDLAAVGEGANGGEIRLLRNLGEAGWADVTKKAGLNGLKLKEPRTLAVADLKNDGSPDLVVTQAGGETLVLQNIGANQNHWMQIDLKALNDNKNGIGTKLEIFAGGLYQKWEIAGASGYLGQNAPELLVGLGKEKAVDVVRLLWPTGVPQDEINLAAGKTQAIAELDRRGSSCPILFSWNGREYEFIADMIGPGVVGHWVAPGERDVPDPDEYLKVPARSVREKNGHLSFRFMEPMEETVYLDQVRLLAVDHPSNVEVNPNERFVSAPPFPEFRVIATQNARVPAGAWDDKGKDVLPLLAKRDRKYVTDFEGLPFAGFAKLHWIELDLGAWDAQKPLRLLLDGYTDYFTATSMYAADQAGIKVIAPYVEAQDAQGNWRRVVEDMGFPAGLARTMVTDLTGKIPAGTRRIRIVSNLKIYWDAVRIDQTPPVEGINVQEVPLAAASLAFLGYPREIRLKPASDTVYSYSHRSPTGPYARAAGNYTRYGDVKKLLGAADDQFAVFGSGEGVELEFDPAGLSKLPAGWTRDYFFYANGFEKDFDFYAAYAFTVEPLPKHGLVSYPYETGKEYPLDEEHLKYQFEYNTRSRSDRLPGNLRYMYTASK
ncbi:MAG TPA: FG-GAP-like repeat-containing protein [Candidatus Acidoferrales bacterium]|nr:FG-GAP-like repeat-containing protein [Candidatus Acidoferrales bacterium]